MSYLPKLLNCLLLIASGSYYASAQNTQPGQPSGKNAPASEAQAKDSTPLSLQQQVALSTALHLLNVLTDLKDDSLRITVQAQIADALWKFDEPRSKRLFQEAYQSVDSLRLPLPQRDELRHRVLRLIALRDDSLAEQLINNTPVDDDLNNGPQGVQMGPSEQYLRLARDIAEADPARAAQMVRVSLSSGVSPWLTSALMSIRRKDAALANELFLATLVAAGRQGPLPLRSIVSLTWYVSPTEEEEFFGRDITSDPVRRAVTEKFLDFAYGIILQQLGSNQEAFSTVDRQMLFHFLQAVLPLFDKFMPDKAAAIRKRLSEAPERISSEQLLELSDASSHDEVQKLLDAAERAGSPRLQDRYHVRAAMAAFRRGDTSLALLISEKIINNNDRSNVGSLIRYQAGLKAIEKRQFNSAQQYAKEITFLPQRVELLNRIAQSLLDGKDAEGATDVLNGLELWLSKADNAPEKALGLLELAKTFASYDPARGFDVLRAAAKVINEADFSQTMSQNKSDTGGLIIPATITVEFLDFKPFALLARNNFSLSLSIAQMIEKRDASVLAQLEICREVLTSTAKLSGSNESRERDGAELPTKPRKARGTRGQKKVSRSP